MALFDDVFPPPKKKVKELHPNASKPGCKHELSEASKRRLATKKDKKKAERDLKKAQKKLHAAQVIDSESHGAQKTIRGDKVIVTQDEFDSVPKKIKEFLADKEILFQPHPGPQTAFLAASEREVFYGGSRGGGKSYALLVDPLRFCGEAYHVGLLLRKTMPELRDLIEHSKKLYPKAYPGARWREQDKEWRFPSGARQEFGYAETISDALRYQGRAYNWIGIDELPQYDSPKIWYDLRGSLRSAHGIPLYMRASGNPGNIGSHWVREMFIDPAPPGETFEITVNLPDGRKKTITRRFIQAKLKDNPSLMQNDDYLIMLASLPEVKRKQWLDGDWDAFENSAFPEFNRTIHVVEPFTIPNNWTRFRACDFGYSSPACILWFAIDFDNNLTVYREYYGKGLTADRLAQRVLAMDQGENIRSAIMDASTWAKRGDVGPSLAEVMNIAGCRWRPSDKSKGSRIAGKLEVHRRLAIDPVTDKPRLQFFNTCKNLIRTLPVLPLDELNCEDVNTNAEDHAYDALRYGCMSRPLNPGQDDNFLEDMKRGMEQDSKPVDRMFGY